MLSNLFLMRKSYSYRTDLLQMLSKLFLLRKRFVTFAEELLSENRSITNTEQVVPHEKFFEICYFCRRVIVTEQICYKC